MKKLSLLFVFAAMFAFASCGPSAEKKANDVNTENVIENTEDATDAPQQETVQQEAGDKTQAVQEEIEATRGTVGDKKTTATEGTINASKKRGDKATEGTIERKDKE
jgi:Skp family chaperone for outer membrane proteins